jgi:hypothetical protein
MKVRKITRMPAMGTMRLPGTWPEQLADPGVFAGRTGFIVIPKVA